MGARALPVVSRRSTAKERGRCQALTLLPSLLQPPPILRASLHPIVQLLQVPD